jgi:hypothetical protein
MKGVGGDGDHHQMHKYHHPHHHHYHHHQIPQDFSLEYSLSGTSSPEAVFSAVVDSEEEEVAQEHRRSLSAPDTKACGPASWDFSPRASLNQALKEVKQSLISPLVLIMPIMARKKVLGFCRDG